MEVRIDDTDGGYYDETITRNAIQFDSISKQKFIQGEMDFLVFAKKKTSKKFTLDLRSSFKPV